MVYQLIWYFRSFYSSTSKFISW